MARKRTRSDVEAEDSKTTNASHPSMLQQLRSMWEFASLFQYLFMFGKVVKLNDDLDIEDIEADCFQPGTPLLSEIGLTLLKFVSSHRGLNYEIFDEYTRRQYVAKAPERNPFGEDEAPKKFSHFDLLTKIRVLHQLTTWTFYNPDRVRSLMPEKDSEQTQWRIEPFGWDSDDRTYFLLDDDRLYRQTDAPLPPTPQKAKAKAKVKSTARRSRGTRTSKRRKLSDSAEEAEDEADGQEEQIMGSSTSAAAQGLGGMKWECVATTLQDYTDLIESLRRSRDPNERHLQHRLTKEVLPVIEKKVESQLRKQAKRQKELENLEKLSTAKRSSRLAGKAEKQREIEQAAEAERKHEEELRAASKEAERLRKREEDRDSRMKKREDRMKERENKRLYQEEELKKLREDSEKLGSGDARLSERHLKAEMEKRQRELEKLSEEEEEDWVFDCSVCGTHGANIDDGSHSIACEKCSVWQHSACHGIPVHEAERDDFHFLCKHCKRREEEKSRPPEAAQLEPQLGSSASLSPDNHPQTNGTAPSLQHQLDAASHGAVNSIEAYAPTHPATHASTKPVIKSEANGYPKAAASAHALSKQPTQQTGHAQRRHESTLPPPIAQTPASKSSHEWASTPYTPSDSPAFQKPTLLPSAFPGGRPSSSSSTQGSGSFGTGSFPPPFQVHATPPNGYDSLHSRPLDASTTPLQRPSSNHFHMQRPGSPVKQPSLSPAPTNGYDSSSQRNPIASSPQSFPPTPMQPPVQSPVKQHSSPYQSHSPVAEGGFARGYSPTKQLSSPPRPDSRDHPYPVLPPIASLQASPPAQILDPPTKKMSPEQPRPPNFS